MHAHATKARSGRGSSSTSGAGTSVHLLLALQRAAGNKAVSAYLQRDPAEPRSQKSSNATVTFSDLGTMEATSVSFPRQPGVGIGGGGSGATKPGDEALREVALTLPMTEQTAKLVRAASEGRPFKKVVITLGTTNVVLTDVMVAGDAVSGAHGDSAGTATITLSGLAAHVESAVDAVSGA